MESCEIGYETFLIGSTVAVDQWVKAVLPSIAWRLLLFCFFFYILKVYTEKRKRNSIFLKKDLIAA